MTTVVAVQKKGRVFLGHDSQATYRSGEKISLRDGKLVTNGPYTFGIAGIADMIDVLADADLPSPEGDTRKFVRTVLAKRILELETSEFGGPANSVLVVVNGEVFAVEAGRLYPSTTQGIYSVGSGSKYAEGYLLSLRRPPLFADVKRALAVAASRDSFTSAPFVVKEVR